MRITVTFCLGICIVMNATASEVPLSVPSGPKAQFFVLQKNGKGKQRTIMTKRVGPSGTSFSTRMYDCDANTVKYIGTGDTLSEMKSSKPDARMSPIVPGSIAYFVGQEACK